VQAFPWGWGTKKYRGTGLLMFCAREKCAKAFLPLPLFAFFLDSRPIFRAGKTPKIPYLGLSLLPNPTETLDT